MDGEESLMNLSKELILNYPFIITHQRTVAFMKGRCLILKQDLIKILRQRAPQSMKCLVPMTE